MEDITQKMDILEDLKETKLTYRQKLKYENGERYQELLKKQREYVRRVYRDPVKRETHQKKMSLAYYQKMTDEQLAKSLARLKERNPEKCEWVVQNIKR